MSEPKWSFDRPTRCVPTTWSAEFIGWTERTMGADSWTATSRSKAVCGCYGGGVRDSRPRPFTEDFELRCSATVTVYLSLLGLLVVTFRQRNASDRLLVATCPGIRILPNAEAPLRTLAGSKTLVGNSRLRYPARPFG
ncbi:hypothetical protein PUNSTDRAFT_123299 [Punctularia strigosozonata HHB-11173 SS5]|uniref:Uncharacterized protein n=1 Tax=Punctularia strigosozonata (strain HHB-11173) TaxID=741275 RepID=R7RYV7_PUNST|nr:uncharacterized protein PUNSTDRAFT_123299 [Punctularia strigosozonata HHB-11173 SS5]EIN03295.1 hypothetical protein PUNSTDRAFT_123299 [Punctularia strigosozonata HHB-11173 SS5]